MPPTRFCQLGLEKRPPPDGDPGSVPTGPTSGPPKAARTGGGRDWLSLWNSVSKSSIGSNDGFWKLGTPADWPEGVYRGSRPTCSASERALLGCICRKPSNTEASPGEI